MRGSRRSLWEYLSADVRWWFKEDGRTSCIAATRLLAENGTAKVDELHDAILGGDHVFQLEVAMCEA